MDFESIYPGFEGRWRLIFVNVFFSHYYYSANSTQLSLFRFSYFITPYDPHASSGSSALIYIGEKKNECTPIHYQAGRVH